MKIFSPHLIVVEPVLQTRNFKKRVAMVFYLQVNSTLEINSQRTFMHTPSWYSQGWGNDFLLSWCNIQTRSGWGLRWTKSIGQYLRVWTLEKMWMWINLLQINYNLILARRRRGKIAKNTNKCIFFLDNRDAGSSKKLRSEFTPKLTILRDVMSDSDPEFDR